MCGHIKLARKGVPAPVQILLLKNIVLGKFHCAGYKGNVDNPSAEHGKCSVSVNGCGSIQIRRSQRAPQGFSGFASRRGSPELQQSRPDWGRKFRFAEARGAGSKSTQLRLEAALRCTAGAAGARREGVPGRGHSRGPGALASSSGSAAGPCPSRWRDLSLPISKTEPPPFPKPF